MELNLQYKGPFRNSVKSNENGKFAFRLKDQKCPLVLHIRSDIIYWGTCGDIFLSHLDNQSQGEA